MVKEQPPHKVEIWRRLLKEVAFGLMECEIQNQPAKDTQGRREGACSRVKEKPRVAAGEEVGRGS